jgi:hypothetical protein
MPDVAQTITYASGLDTSTGFRKSIGVT